MEGGNGNEKKAAQVRLKAETAEIRQHNKEVDKEERVCLGVDSRR